MDEIREFIDAEIETQHTMMVIGPSKSGKTSFCNQVLKDRSFLRIDHEAIENHADLIKQVSNYVSTARIGEAQHLQKIIFIDDVDILLSQDRFCNNYIQTHVIGKGIKLLMTCVVSEERKISDIKKKASQLIRLPPLHVITDPLQEYFNKNIYQVVECLFENPQKPLANTELAISIDPMLISFIMYDNYKSIFVNSYHQPNKEYIRMIATAYMHTSLMEDAVYRTNDYAIISLIRCHTIRMAQQFMMAQAQALTPPPRKQQKHVMHYTQITSRSAQHFNVLKKHMIASELTPHNIALMSQLTKNHDIKTTHGAVCHAFKYNISLPQKKKKNSRDIINA